MRKCNFICISKIIMAFLEAIFTKFIRSRKNYVQVSHNKFRKKISVQLTRIFYIFLTVHLRIILVGNQLDAKFLL